MAHLVIPYVEGMLRSETIAAVDACPLPHDYYQLDHERPGDYAALVVHLWDTGETFVVLEHDVAPEPGMITALAECPEQWCWHEYADNRYGPGPSMGLTKFSAELMARWPNAPQVALYDRVRHRDPVHWRSMDTVLRLDLEARKVPAHRHFPDVVHLNPFYYGHSTPQTS